jgi:RimJ/RimL family protein N-acetyltransferase
MSNNNLPVLTSNRVTLRRPREDDVAARFRLGTDPEIVRMYGGSRADFRPMTEEAARRWVQQLMDHDYAWIIDAGGPIGSIRLDRVDRRDRRANLAVGIEEAAQLGIGLGTEAVSLVLGYAFDILELHRITVRVVQYNDRAIRAYQKCGFTIEGREREAALVDGNWYDDVIMGILDREFSGAKRNRA